MATVCESASSFLIVSRFFLSSIHARPFMSPFLFYFSNISDAFASALFLLVILVASTCAKFYRTFSCVSYFVTSNLPCPLDFLIPVFHSYCVLIMWSMWIYLFSWWYLALFRLCSGGCSRFCDFYPLRLVLSFYLVSCLWFCILQSVLLTCLVLIRLLW